eukprot:TRINITY_DN24279_c0_g1_i2.p1 TRINITY_DN24279_c0_g1~~TRINITY_DN24279_c0_g1_i2.p1  ORF type:complete len:234 (-),score=31.70 TRINITY_DN24279_c0_g1_i2:106-807(-)
MWRVSSHCPDQFLFEFAPRPGCSEIVSALVKQHMANLLADVSQYIELTEATRQRVTNFAKGVSQQKKERPCSNKSTRNGGLYKSETSSEKLASREGAPTQTTGRSMDCDDCVDQSSARRQLPQLAPRSSTVPATGATPSRDEETEDFFFTPNDWIAVSIPPDCRNEERPKQNSFRERQLLGRAVSKKEDRDPPVQRRAHTERLQNMHLTFKRFGPTNLPNGTSHGEVFTTFEP